MSDEKRPPAEPDQKDPLVPKIRKKNELPNTQPGWDAGGSEGNVLHEEVNPFVLRKERTPAVHADPKRDQTTRELGGRIVRWRESLLNTDKKKPEGS